MVLKCPGRSAGCARTGSLMLSGLWQLDPTAVRAGCAGGRSGEVKKLGGEGERLWMSVPRCRTTGFVRDEVCLKPAVVFSGNSLSAKGTCCLLVTVGSTFDIELLDEAWGSSMAMCWVFCSDSLEVDWCGNPKANFSEPMLELLLRREYRRRSLDFTWLSNLG